LKIINFSIIYILLGTLVGILIYDIVDWSLYISIFVSLFSFTGLITLHLFAKKKTFSELPFIIGVCLLFLTIGYLTRYRADVLNQKNHYSYFKKDISQTLLFSIEKELKPSQYQHKYIIKLHQIDKQSVSGIALLNLSKDSLSVLPKIGQWYHSKTEFDKT